MNVPLQIPAKVSPEEAEAFFQGIGLGHLVEIARESKSKSTITLSAEPLPPNLIDLYRIFSLVTLNRRLKVLEFGCGYSSLVIATALKQNERLHGEEAKALRLRSDKLFHLHTVDNELDFIAVARKHLELFELANSSFNFSEVRMTRFNGRLCHEYERLPQVNPDFIYLDGPGKRVLGDVNNLSVAQADMMPMSSDLLLLEHFFCPGTIILIDGRTANSRFLQANFQRNWSVVVDSDFDQTIFVLDEEPLGPANRAQLEFYAAAPATS